MRHIKFITLGFACLALLSIFGFAYVKDSELSLTLWSVGELSGSKAAAYMALLGSLSLIGISGFAVKKGELGRKLSAGMIPASLLVAIAGISGFTAETPFAKFAGGGAYILVFGGLLAFVLSVAVLIKPDRGSAPNGLHGSPA